MKKSTIKHPQTSPPKSPEKQTGLAEKEKEKKAATRRKPMRYRIFRIMDFFLDCRGRNRKNDRKKNRLAGFE